MRKIVLPLIETDRSLLALQYAKKHFGKDQAEIIIVMSDENLGISATREEEAAALSVVERKLDVIKKVLDGYQVITKAFVGKAGPCIVKVAREYNADYIVMTKSARSDTLSVVGKTADYVLNNAYCNVLIISENRINSGEYKGLIYKKAQATVNLRGQIGDKQSECLLPSVDADCNYHFDVTVGKIRFFHTAYNPETGNWDMPPSGDQTASIDIVAGETADILVKANSIDGKADRIRIINRGMKQEAVFEYKITAASAPQPLDIPDAPGAMPAPAVISLDAEDKVDEVAAETAEAAEAIFEEMPVPSIYDTAEFEGISPEEAYTTNEDMFEYEDLVEDALGTNEVADEAVFEDTIAEESVVFEDTEAVEEPVAFEEIEVAEEPVALDETEVPEEPAAFEETDGFEIFDELAMTEEPAKEDDYAEKKEISFNWDDIDFGSKEKETPIESTLTGLEMFTPDENEISSIVDELKTTITNIDNDIAAREGRTMRFGLPEEDIEDSINIENFFDNTGLGDDYSTSGVATAFDDIFEMIPSRDPVKHASTSTISHDFDEIINEFRTSQMGYTGVSLSDDDDLDEFK